VLKRGKGIRAFRQEGGEETKAGAILLSSTEKKKTETLHKNGVSRRNREEFRESRHDSVKKGKKGEGQISGI